MDSSPLGAAGRVEDTVNLLAHAARKLISCAGGLLEWSTDRVAEEAGMTLFMGSSIKRALDIDWADEAAKRDAIDRVAKEVESLQEWI